MNKINFPTEAEEKALIKQSLARIHAQRAEHRLAAINGAEALPRLVAVLRGRTGQAYHLRRLLYSLWNGAAIADLTTLLNFDWEIRRDLCRLFLGWGFEDDQTKLFYKAMESELRAAGQFEWFIDQGEN